MKNITLSADERLIANARLYAQAQGTTLNELIRGYLAQLAAPLDRRAAAAEFARLARAEAGRSPAGWRFDREEAHRRGSKR
jgi:plasmid replication initiation protein